jgi:hypothetical protein
MERLEIVFADVRLVLGFCKISRANGLMFAYSEIIVLARTCWFLNFPGFLVFGFSVCFGL